VAAAGGRFIGRYGVAPAVAIAALIPGALGVVDTLAILFRPFEQAHPFASEFRRGRLFRALAQSAERAARAGQDPRAALRSGLLETARGEALLGFRRLGGDGSARRRAARKLYLALGALDAGWAPARVLQLLAVPSDAAYALAQVIDAEEGGHRAACLELARRMRVQAALWSGPERASDILGYESDEPPDSD